MMQQNVTNDALMCVAHDARLGLSSAVAFVAHLAAKTRDFRSKSRNFGCVQRDFCAPYARSACKNFTETQKLHDTAKDTSSLLLRALFAGSACVPHRNRTILRSKLARILRENFQKTSASAAADARMTQPNVTNDASMCVAHDARLGRCRVAHFLSFYDVKTS